MGKKILKVVLGIVGVIVLLFGSLFVLVKAGVDVSSVIKMMNSSQDKAKRPSPPATASGSINGANITVEYSQPAKNGREVFGKLIPYGEVWRTGANEATEITVSKDVMVAGQPLKAGRYQLFTIPTADKWTIIFNSKLGQWGAFFYDPKSDVLKVEVPSSASNDTILERLILQVETTPMSGLSIMWDKTKVFVPITAP
jgi:hypothetical protein